MAEKPSELNETIPVKERADPMDGTVAETTDEKHLSYKNPVPDHNLERRSHSLDTTETVNTAVKTSETSSSSNEEEVLPDTEELKSQIEDTRHQMSETIDAIQEKLSIANISEQVKDEVSEHINSAIKTAKESVYEATLGKVGNIMNYVNKGMNELAETDAMRKAGKNPLAVTLIGVGIGLLVVNGFSKKRKTHYYQNNYDYNSGNYSNNPESNRMSREVSTGDHHNSNSQSTFATAQNTVTDAAGKVGETISGAAGKVGETVSGAASAVSGTVTDVAGQAYKQVGNLGSQVKDIAGSAQDQYEYYIEENPLAVGAVALALGAAVGMAIPSTRFEGSLMGETRDNLVQKAQDTAQDAIGKVQKAAGNVTESVKQAAGDIAQNVKDSAGDVTQTVKDEAKKQGLT